MRRPTLLLIVLTLLNVPAPAADDPPPEGFVRLFDGKTLDGWKTVNTKDNFVVRDGVLVMDKGSGWLATEKTFADFELRIRYRFVTPGADSGVFIRSSLEGKNWTENGYQVQNMDNETLGMIVGMGLKVKSDRKPEVVRRVKKKAGDWMDLTIRVKGKHAEVDLNGERVAESDDMQRADGHIGLQAEGGVLEFRSILIKKDGDQAEGKELGLVARLFEINARFEGLRLEQEQCSSRCAALDRNMRWIDTRQNLVGLGYDLNGAALFILGKAVTTTKVVDKPRQEAIEFLGSALEVLSRNQKILNKISLEIKADFENFKKLFDTEKKAHERSAEELRMLLREIERLAPHFAGDTIFL